MKPQTHPPETKSITKTKMALALLFLGLGSLAASSATIPSKTLDGFQIDTSFNTQKEFTNKNTDHATVLLTNKSREINKDPIYLFLSINPAAKVDGMYLVGERGNKITPKIQKGEYIFKLDSKTGPINKFLLSKGESTRAVIVFPKLYLEGSFNGAYTLTASISKNQNGTDKIKKSYIVSNLESEFAYCLKDYACTNISKKTCAEYYGTEIECKTALKKFEESYCISPDYKCAPAKAYYLIGQNYNCYGKPMYEDKNTCDAALDTIVKSIKDCSQGKQVITKPGTYVISSCDSIEYGGAKMNFTSTQGSSVEAETKKIVNGKEITRNAYASPYDVFKNDGIVRGPYFSFLGINVSLNKTYFVSSTSYTTNLVEIALHDSCQPIYDKCLESEKKLGANIFCEQVCGEYSQIPSVLDYEQRKNVVVSGPKGYTMALALAADNAQNCYNEMTKFWLFEAPIPVYLRYAKTDDNKGVCSFGPSYGINCRLSDQVSDENILKEKPMNINNLDYNLQKKFIDAGYCMAKQQIIGNQNHEMTHWLNGNTFPAITAFLSEGVAMYGEYKYGAHAYAYDNELYFYSSSLKEEDLEPLKSSFKNIYFSESNWMDSALEFEPLCQEGGMVYQGTTTKYKIAPNEYREVACFLYDIEKTYGIDKVKQIISYADGSNPGCLKLFQDVVNPVVGEDAYAKLKNKYNLTADPEVCLDEPWIK